MDSYDEVEWSQVEIIGTQCAGCLKTILDDDEIIHHGVKISSKWLMMISVCRNCAQKRLDSF